ncbi:MAG: SpoIIE family protein phosphatase [Bacteroidota bacterium]
MNEFNLTDPGLILDKCRELISEVFNTGNDQIRDGMDISIITIDLKNKQFQWAGANNPLWYIQNGALQILKGTKQHIGFCENPVPFTTHTVSLYNNETFYMFSDGYSDQFGGEAGKKYKTAAFKSLIESVHLLPLQQQKSALNESFNSWRGELEQVDDVSIIGFKI